MLLTVLRLGRRPPGTASALQSHKLGDDRGAGRGPVSQVRPERADGPGRHAVCAAGAADHGRGGDAGGGLTWLRHAGGGAASHGKKPERPGRDPAVAASYAARLPPLWVRLFGRPRMSPRSRVLGISQRHERRSPGAAPDPGLWHRRTHQGALSVKTLFSAAISMLFLSSSIACENR